MKKLAATLLLCATCVSAQSPPVDYVVACQGSDILVIVGVNAPGVYKLRMPANVCGTGI